MPKASANFSSTESTNRCLNFLIKISKSKNWLSSGSKCSFLMVNSTGPRISKITHISSNIVEETRCLSYFLSDFIFVLGLYWFPIYTNDLITNFNPLVFGCRTIIEYLNYVQARTISPATSSWRKLIFIYLDTYTTLLPMLIPIRLWSSFSIGKVKIESEPAAVLKTSSGFVISVNI